MVWHDGQMPRFASYDGTELAYQIGGHGPTMICVSGNPGHSSAYLGDLGGLDLVRTLVRLDNRGTGESAVPDDPATYRVDRLVADVEALRRHLGLDTINLLGHGAGANITALYAAAYPDRLASLTSVAGLLRVAGFDSDPIESGPTESGPGEIGLIESGPGEGTASADGGVAPPARDGFWAGYQPDPLRVRQQLANVTAPVLVIVGERDVSPTPAVSADIASLFSKSSLVTIPGAGHVPWRDNPDGFVAALGTVLS